MPDSIVKIGDRAFEKSSNLTEIKLSDSLTEIGASAFKSCKKLKSVVLPEGLERIEENAFNGSVLETLKQKAMASGLPEDAQKVSDYENMLERFEKKVSDFEKALELCYEVLANLSGAAKHLTRAETDLQNLSLLNAEHKAYLRSDIRINLEQIKPIVDTLCRQIKRIDADLVGSHLDFDIKIEIGNYSDDISEWKAEVEHLIPQIEEIQRNLNVARDRWAKVAGERRTELHEQIKAVLA